MRRSTLLIIAAIALTSPGLKPADASVIYNVNFSDPINNPANVTLTGTITVDSLGTLTTSDIVDFSLTFTSDRFGPRVVNLTNGSIGPLGDVILLATTSDLTITLPSPSGNLVQFAIGSTGNAQTYLDFVGGGGIPAQRIISLAAESNPSDRDYSQTGGQLNGGLTFLVGSASPSVVPEPSSFVTSGTAAVLGLGCWLRRRRAKA